MKNKYSFINTFLLLHLILNTSLYSQSYNWPLKPFNQQHNISATFCENRPSGSVLRDHFHNAIDIPFGQGGVVYSVSNGTVTTIDPVGSNSYVRVGRFAYVHINPNPALRVGDQVYAYQTIIGTTNSQNHIHFIDGYYNYEVNPLLDNRLEPFQDLYNPVISYIKFYANKTERQFSQNKVSGLVDIVSRAMDITDTGPLGANNGVYIMGYQIFQSDGTTPIMDPIEHFLFNAKPNNQYIKNVYFNGSNLSTYIYIPTNFIHKDGYWDTRLVDPGDYVVEVYVGDTKNNFASKITTVTVIEQDVLPPATPVLSSVRLIDEKDLQISWNAVSDEDIAGYRLYFSYDAQSWNLFRNETKLTSVDSSLVVPNFNVRVPIYFVLSAVDNAAIPNESEHSTLMGIRANEDAPRILLVNGYEKDTPHQIVKTYAEDMNASSIYLFESCNQAVIKSELSDLLNYEMVFYFFGEDSAFLSKQEKGLLKSYLQNGGNLMLSGSQMVSAFFKTDSSDSLFYYDYFKCKLGETLTYVDTVYGSSSQVWSGKKIEVGKDAPLATVQALVPMNDSENLVERKNNTVGILFNGMFPEGTKPGGLVLLGFPFESITSDILRAELLDLIFDEFLLQTGVPFSEQNGTHVLDDFELTCYPNPIHFNNSKNMVIQYRLPSLGQVKIDIFNLLGQKIRTLFSGTLSAGIKQITWDGKNEQGSFLLNGIYFVVISSNKFKKSQKILYLNST